MNTFVCTHSAYQKQQHGLSTLRSKHSEEAHFFLTTHCQKLASPEICLAQWRAFSVVHIMSSEGWEERDLYQVWLATVLFQTARLFEETNQI